MEIICIKYQILFSEKKKKKEKKNHQFVVFWNNQEW